MNTTQAFESALAYVQSQGLDLGSSDWRTVLRIRDSQDRISHALLENIGAPVDRHLPIRDVLRYAGCVDQEVL